MRLQGKTILITGANRGIGRAIAEELATHPVHLLLGMRNIADYKPIDGQALSIKPIQMELSSLSNIQRDITAAESDLNNLDILINNAGLFVAGPLEAQNLEKMAAMVQVNLAGLMQLTAQLLPTIRKHHGKIVNNASIAGYAYFPLDATYSATKAGVVAFSEALRRELHGTGVSVLHLVTPAVSTDMFKDVDATYKKNGVSQLSPIMPEVWARKVVRAIETDRTMLKPTGTTELVRLLSRGPRILLDLASRRLVSH